MRSILFLLLTCAVYGDTKFHPVTPVARGSAGGANLQIAAGRFFSYALPAGWRVGEDGQFALTLVSPDTRALTVMVGNAGLPVQYQPGRFVYEKLMAMRPGNLQVGQGRQAAPAQGFRSAVAFEFTMVFRGVPMRGVAKCNIQPAYDTALLAMTAAMSEAGQWAGYSSWLPQVADQVSASNGAAFGVRGVMAQNLKNSVAYGEAAARYREWSAKNSKAVTDDRARSDEKRNAGVREILGGSAPYANPFGETREVELPGTYKYYWTNRQGVIQGTDDPSADPNAGSTKEWRAMKRAR